MPERPPPTDRDLLLLLKVEHVEQAVQRVAQDVQSLAPLLEKIIGLLAAHKTPPKPQVVASYGQLYPDVAPSAEEDAAPAQDGPPPQRGGWGRLFSKRGKA